MKSWRIRSLMFWAAVSSQPYIQADREDGLYVLPRGYHHLATLSKRAGINTDPFGFIMESDRRLVIAFRGTDTLIDLLSDLKVEQVNYPFAKGAGKTHRGFTELYDSLRDTILSVMRDASPAKTLVLTGHSLGGALASLCALDAAEHSPFRTPTVCTFGSPRAGDEQFVRAFARKIRASTRVANENDWFVRNPPLSMRIPFNGTPFHYRHVPGEVPLRFRDGELKGTHSIEAYYRALSAMAPEAAVRLERRNPGFTPQPGWRKTRFRLGRLGGLRL